MDDNLPQPDELTYTPQTFGTDWAEIYDIVEPYDSPDIPEQVKVLADLANKGPVLEVAAGTGRLAVPLAENGLDVTATDASAEMLAVLKKNDKKSLVKSHVDTLPNISEKEKYNLICIFVNSIWWLDEAQTQRAFLRQACEHLTDSGVLVVEMGVGNPQNWTEPKFIEFPQFKLKRSSNWSPVTQKLLQRYEINRPDGSVEVKDVVVRALFPNELLLMGEVTGLKTKYIWSGWDKKPFDADSQLMITVFEKIEHP